MKNNTVKVVLGIIVLIILLFLIFKLKKEDKVFNKVVLSNFTTIDNGVFPTYYDTVLSVAMNKMGVGGHVIIGQLSDNAKSQFDGDLKAHIRYFNSKFYFFSIIIYFMHK